MEVSGQAGGSGAGIAVMDKDAPPEAAQFSQEDLVDPSVLEQMLKTKQAPEPGDFMQARVLHAGDEDLPTPMVADSLVSAGHIYVWHTQTGERSTINRNMLALQLSKKIKLADNKVVRAFSTSPPAGVTPVRGTLRCRLHPQDPHRKEYDRVGFPTCSKENLKTLSDVDQHMRARHKREWESIEKDRAERERQEDRAFQRSMMQTQQESIKALTGVVKANRETAKAKGKKNKE